MLASQTQLVTLWILLVLSLLCTTSVSVSDTGKDSLIGTEGKSASANKNISDSASTITNTTTVSSTILNFTTISANCSATNDSLADCTTGVSLHPETGDKDGSNSIKILGVDINGMYVRAFYVIIAVAGIVVIYFGVKTFL